MLLVEIGMQESWKAITRRRVDIARALSNSMYVSAKCTLDSNEKECHYCPLH